MSHNSTGNSFQGFSVFQASLGAPLQFLPAVGTKELDELINACLPGPASIKEKRATISMDFCEYASLTGETFKYYAVVPSSFNSVTSDSPASSAMLDSGYGSAFNVSPAMSDLNVWGQSASFASPSTQSFASSASPEQQRRHTSSSRKSSGSTARGQTTDFSHLPGMKIMTKDGLDVTNSASRGCKTKEQRDHAHLMRILKACESCKKKKIRCDPSHKRRAASQAQLEEVSAKPSKKSRKAVPASQSQSPTERPESVYTGTLLEVDSQPVVPTDESFVIGTLNGSESWEQFVQYDPVADEPTSLYPPNYEPFFFDMQDFFSSPSSGSPTSPAQPFTPALAVPSTATLGNTVFPELDKRAPALPYLNPEDVQGSNYVDFNLYSPASSFQEEDPQLFQEVSYRAEFSSRDTGTRRVLRDQMEQVQAISPAATTAISTEASTSEAGASGLVMNQAWFAGGMSRSLNPDDPGWRVSSEHGSTDDVTHIQPATGYNSETCGSLDDATFTSQRTEATTHATSQVRHLVSRRAVRDTAIPTPLGPSPPDIPDAIVALNSLSTVSSSTSTSAVLVRQDSSGSDLDRSVSGNPRLRRLVSSGCAQSDELVSALAVSSGPQVLAGPSPTISPYVSSTMVRGGDVTPPVVRPGVEQQLRQVSALSTPSAADNTIEGLIDLGPSHYRFGARRGTYTRLSGVVCTSSASSQSSVALPGEPTLSAQIGQSQMRQSVARPLAYPVDGSLSATGLSQPTGTPSPNSALGQAYTRHSITMVSDGPFSSALAFQGPAETGLATSATGSLVNVLLTASILSTLPIRQSIARIFRCCMQSSSHHVSSNFSVAFGIISVFLVYSLQTHFCATLHGLFTVPMLFLSLAALSSRHSDAECSEPFSASTKGATPQDTIDNVKSKIHTLSGWRFSSTGFLGKIMV